MKKMIAGSLAAMMAAGSASAGGVDKAYQARQYLGQATGYMAVCAYLVPTEALAKEVERRIDQRVLTAGDTIYASEQRTIIAGADTHLESGLAGYCSKGLAEFGPGGNKADGWLSFNVTVLPWKVERLNGFSRDRLKKYATPSSEPAARTDDAAGQIIGELFAYKQFCEVLRVDDEALNSWAIALGTDISRIDADGGRDEAIAAAKRAIPKLESRTISDVCAEALRLFGPRGALADGVLVSP